MIIVIISLFIQKELVYKDFLMNKTLLFKDIEYIIELISKYKKLKIIN